MQNHRSNKLHFYNYYNHIKSDLTNIINRLKKELEIMNNFKKHCKCTLEGLQDYIKYSTPLIQTINTYEEQLFHINMLISILNIDDILYEPISYKDIDNLINILNS